VESGPRVSVIIPVRDRRKLLAEALDALTDQEAFDDFEVLVVDDGSRDGSAEEAAGRVIAGRPVRVIEGDGQGAVAARTIGVEQAHGEILAFTDSDCVPRPRWLAEGVAAVDAGADVVNGRTVPARAPRPFERSNDSGTEGLYPTCNVFYRREAFLAAGGFDGYAGERLGFRPDRKSKSSGFGEDTLLAWRVARAGTARYAPEAIVEHAVFDVDHPETFRRVIGTAAFPALVKEVPELRETLLQWRWQLGPRTRLPIYGLAVALLARRWRLAAVLFGWWAGLRLYELRRFPISRRARLQALPAEMAYDALMAGALAVGSARARSITL
jgi:glycosyltransferase involved in cell wall biosynthesis